MQTIQIYFDGGCRPTNPGNKYGSFEIILDGETVHAKRRLELGWGTNNEAEFEILIAALDWVVENLVFGGFDTEDYRVELFTDSMILRNRILGKFTRANSEPQQRMARLSSKCLERLGRFSGFEAVWKRREANVARFGH